METPVRPTRTATAPGEPLPWWSTSVAAGVTAGLPSGSPVVPTPPLATIPTAPASGSGTAVWLPSTSYAGTARRRKAPKRGHRRT